MSDDLVKTMRAIAITYNWRPPTRPLDVTQDWERFVEECVAGYPSGYYEFLDEIGVRGFIDEILNDSSIHAAPGWDEFSAAVSTSDHRYKEILLPQVQIVTQGDAWWARSIPRYAGEEFVDDVNSILGATIRLGP